MQPSTCLEAWTSPSTATSLLSQTFSPSTAGTRWRSCLTATTCRLPSSSVGSGTSLVTLSTGTSEAPRSRSLIFCYAVSLSPPPFLHSTCITLPSLVHQTLMVLQASSGLEVDTVLTVCFCNQERARPQLFYRPLRSHEAGNHGPGSGV